jgi:hypothetical protein
MKERIRLSSLEGIAEKRAPGIKLALGARLLVALLRRGVKRKKAKGS